MPCTPPREEVEIIRQRTRPFVNKIRLESMKGEIEGINANIRRLYKFRQAMRIIKKANTFFSENLAIAMSGGKDSLVTLYLALKINPKIPVIFNNTTVEFPETVDFVQKLAKEWNFNLYITKPKISFFKAVKNRGWATHEDRWCCAPYKDEPALEFLIKNGIVAEITGTTRTESIYRRNLTPFRMPTKNPWIMRINPIYDWNEWEVWAYIRGKKLPYNPLYNKGFRRIGCWCCPINGWSHYRRISKTHPKLFHFLEHFSPLHPSIKKLKQIRD